jgi:hypothetical protein
VLIVLATFFAYGDLMLSMLGSSALYSALMLVGRWGIALTVLFGVGGLRLTRRALQHQDQRGVHGP